MYFKSNGEIHAQALFKPNGSKPGFPASYIHRQYLEAVSSDAKSKDVTWRQWLEQHLCVRYHPELLVSIKKPGEAEFWRLSTDFKYVLRHQSKYVVELLYEVWPDLPDDLSDYEDVLNELSEAQVPIKNGCTRPLNRTWLPSEELKGICKDLGLPNGLAFLDLPRIDPADIGERWNFLAVLEVSMQVDVHFYLAMLVAFSDAQMDGLWRSLSRIYLGIQQYSDTDQDTTCVRWVSMRIYFFNKF